MRDLGGGVSCGGLEFWPYITKLTQIGVGSGGGGRVLPTYLL